MDQSQRKKGPRRPFFKRNPKKQVLFDREIEELTAKYPTIDAATVATFDDFPLSKLTREGLKAQKFSEPTDIQRDAIGVALQGRDVLGSAQTGSGKTLAFLIPILECLYRERVSSQDGMCALVISPTRELAYQTFEVLKKVGKKHDFSAGLIVGGMNLREEELKIANTNIGVCTPGRLQQHMEQTASFTTDGIKILVLDEADKILSLGFRATMHAIIESLPVERQTLLYSATQTRQVNDLAGLSLRNPAYVAVHDKSKFATPSKLEQSYIICKPEEKLSVLWYFIRGHPQTKILVFIQTCKQVRFVTDVFHRMRLGTTVLPFHGSMKQVKRVAAYDEFCRKQSVVMICTDVAARGLDFPEVQWVIQMDCPEDAETYVHRVGRTARYKHHGESLLMLTPTEEKEMTKRLQQHKIPIEEIKINPRRMGEPIDSKIQSQVAADPELKGFAERAFVAYLKSVYLMGNKKVFNVRQIDTDKLSQSMGLVICPRVRFLNKAQHKHTAQAAEAAEAADQSATSSGGTVQQAKGTVPTEAKLGFDWSRDDSDSDDDGNDKDGLYSVKPQIEAEDSSSSEDSDDSAKEGADPSSKSGVVAKPLTKAAIAKKLKKRRIKVNALVKYDEDGNVIPDLNATPQDGGMTEGGIDIEQSQAAMEQRDADDKQRFKVLVKAKHRAQRLKAKEERRAKRRRMNGEEEEAPVAYLDSGDDEQEKFNASELPDPDSSDNELQGDDSDASEGSDEENTTQVKRKIAQRNQSASQSVGRAAKANDGGSGSDEEAEGDSDDDDDNQEESDSDGDDDASSESSDDDVGTKGAAPSTGGARKRKGMDPLEHTDLLSGNTEDLAAMALRLLKK